MESPFSLVYRGCPGISVVSSFLFIPLLVHDGQDPIKGPEGKVPSVTTLGIPVQF